MSNILSAGKQSNEQLIALCNQALAQNQVGDYHAPHRSHYPELFGWDSPMHSIGTRHVAPSHAAQELYALFRGQWEDGRLPNIQFPRHGGFLSSLFWNSGAIARHNAPPNIRTSGITQPPLAAEAIWLVGKKLPDETRKIFWSELTPRVMKYHEWLYAARCQKDDGLIEIVHPWESGMDNTPPLMEYMRSLDWGTPIGILDAIKKSLRLFRKDLRYVDGSERSSDDEAVLQMVSFMSLVRSRYDARRLQEKHPLHFADIAFNSILARANVVLEMLTKESGQVVPENLLVSMQKTRENFGKLKDPETGMYFSRGRDGSLIRIPTVASLLPLYAGVISQEERAVLIEKLADSTSFWQPHGIPTVPIDSPYFSDKRYWSGGVWGNMEWMIANGLARSGETDRASLIIERTLSTNPGFHEYHSALTGIGYGVSPFSWSASVRLDFAHQAEQSDWSD